MIDRVDVGIIGIVAALVLIVLRMQVGVVLGIVAFVGTAVLAGTTAAWGLMSVIPQNFIADWNLSAVPTFLLMGYIAAQAKLTKGLFQGARICLSRVPGGLASATVVASAMFASASGSSVATSAAFARIAVPEMLKSNYRPSLATGCVAAAGTLGSLIPPSILLILYGIFTETSIRQLFLGGAVPGIVSAIAFLVMISVRAKLDPTLAPLTDKRHTRAEVWAAVKDMWPLPVLVIGVLGGIFAGTFSPTEAGAVGAVLALVIALIRRSLNRKALMRALRETAEGTATIFLIAIGAKMFSVFIALSALPTAMTRFLLSFVESPVAIIIAIAVVYFILGMFVDGISTMLLTIPVIYPVLTGLGVELVWFGIITIKLLEMGMVTPPVGLNVYVIRSALGSTVPLGDIFKGTAWFLLTDIITLAILIAFPAITLYLPSLVR